MPYLIDGNNLLGSWGVRGAKAVGAGSRPPDARAEVVRRVAEFCRAKGASATVVFDGAPFRGDLGNQDFGPVRVRFPEAGCDADSVIREILDRASRPSDYLLVTSDRALYSFALTRGASVLRAHEWNAVARGAAPRRRVMRRHDSEKPERETDIEGWLRRFSGE